MRAHVRLRVRAALTVTQAHPFLAELRRQLQAAESADDAAVECGDNAVRAGDAPAATTAGAGEADAAAADAAAADAAAAPAAAASCERHDAAPDVEHATLSVPRGLAAAFVADMDRLVEQVLHMRVALAQRE